MNNVNIDRVLEQIRTTAAELKRPAQTTEAATESPFALLLRQSLEEVHQSQQRASDMAQAFERGDDGVDLVRVMIEQQKARVSFEALVQVRNRFVSAYEDIMNMPV